MARLVIFVAVVLLALAVPVARSATVAKLLDFQESSGAVPLATQPDTRLQIFCPNFDSIASGNTTDHFGCADYPPAEKAAVRFSFP